MHCRLGSAAAAIMLTTMASPLQAADTGGSGAPVHGADVMDGKDKPGQDGWSWAPIPRDQAASKSAATPGEEKRAEGSASPPAPNSGTRLSPGQDPGTPAPAKPERPASAQQHNP